MPLEGIQSFKELYAKYNSLVYNTALNFTKNEVDAEEVTQEVFIKIHLNLKKFKGNSTLKTWIYRITINASLQHIKKNKVTFLHIDGDRKLETPDFNHPGVILEKKEDAIILYKTLEILPDSQKTAFILSYIEGLPRQNVADIMETTLKSVESLLQRAKHKMRKHLINSYPERRNFKKK